MCFTEEKSCAFGTTSFWVNNYFKSHVIVASQSNSNPKLYHKSAFVLQSHLSFPLSLPLFFVMFNVLTSRPQIVKPGAFRWKSTSDRKPFLLPPVLSLFWEEAEWKILLWLLSLSLSLQLPITCLQPQRYRLPAVHHGNCSVAVHWDDFSADVFLLGPLQYVSSAFSIAGSPQTPLPFVCLCEHKWGIVSVALHVALVRVHVYKWWCPALNSWWSQEHSVLSKQLSAG